MSEQVAIDWNLTEEVHIARPDENYQLYVDLEGDHWYWELTDDRRTGGAVVVRGTCKTRYEAQAAAEKAYQEYKGT